MRLENCQLWAFLTRDGTLWSEMTTGRSSEAGTIGCLEGRCQVEERIAGCPERAPSSRTRGNAGEIAPSAKGGVARGTVLGGGEAVKAELKVIVDPAMGGEEALCVAR